MKICPSCSSEVPSNFDLCWKCNYNFISKSQESDSTKTEEDNALSCLRCHTKMLEGKKINVDEGTNWGVFGDLGHLFTNKMSFQIYTCPNCRKIEFYVPE